MMATDGPMISPHGRTASWSLSSTLLLVFGAILVIVGSYFVFVRPALLPEDLRYIGITQAQLDSSELNLAAWLKQVFRVMGGYVAATGLLTMTLAATSFRAREPIAVAGALAAGAVSIGWMTVVNFAIASDFKWVLLAIALVWVSSILLFWVEPSPARKIGAGR
jgi:hypothetical protein